MDLRSLGLSKEELSLSYAKYWYEKYPEFDPQTAQLIAGPMDPKNAMPVENINEMLKPGYLPGEVGYCNLPDGTSYGAFYVDMPGCTLDMIDWWFVWHFVGPNKDIVPEGNGNLRYKIWNPAMHWDTGYWGEEGEKSRQRALDETIPMRDRRYGSVNYITETMNWFHSEPEKRITQYSMCVDPLEFGFEPALLKTKDAGSIVCAQHPSLNDAGYMVTYHYRETHHGVEMRARSWQGVSIVDGKIVHAKQAAMPDEQAVRDSYWHSLMEYRRLAAYLPRLYAEESQKPLDAY